MVRSAGRTCAANPGADDGDQVIVPSRFAEQLRRARAATATAAEVHARATRAVAAAVATVSEVAVRHGHRLPAGGPATSRVFTAAGVGAARHAIKRAAWEAGLGGPALEDFVLAVQELMTNAVRHGGGWGRVRLHRDGDRLVCEVTDHGPGLTGDPERFSSPPPVRSDGGRGLFLVRQLTGGCRIETGPAGVRVTVTMDLDRP